MGKRRVYVPERGRGWSNGRYWNEKRNSREDGTHGEVYRAHCDDCNRETLHQWDDCLTCEEQRQNGKPKTQKNDTAPSEFKQHMHS